MSHWEYYNRIVKEAVLKNRETFDTEFSVIKRKEDTNLPRHVYKHFTAIRDSDHNRTFIIPNKNYILISSPYDHTNEIPFIENGWTKYLNLYCNSATTWYKIVPFKSKILLGNSVTLK